MIQVGAYTEVELKEKKHRVEDAVAATRAALEEGIVAGGGTVLVHAAAAIDDSTAADDDERGRFPDREARRCSRRCSGSPRTPASPVTWSCPRSAELPLGQGFNAATGEYGDLIADGVIDPVKVTRSAVEHAGSIAAMLLTTEALVVEKPEEEEDDDHGHGHSHHPGHTH